MSDTIERLDDILKAFAVDVTEPQMRRAKAVLMANADITPEDAEAVFTHTERTAADQLRVPGLVAALALAPTKIRDAVAALRVYSASKASRDATPSRQFGESLWKKPFADDVDAAWEHDRMCRVVYCRVVSDRRSKEEVAQELGIKVGTIGAMLDRGRLLQSPPDFVLNGKKEKLDGNAPSM